MLERSASSKATQPSKAALLIIETVPILAFFKEVHFWKAYWLIVVMFWLEVGVAFGLTLNSTSWRFEQL